MSDTKTIVISEQTIINKIYLIRGYKVMIDRDLSEMYGVDPRAESSDKTE